MIRSGSRGRQLGRGALTIRAFAIFRGRISKGARNLPDEKTNHHTTRPTVSTNCIVRRPHARALSILFVHWGTCAPCGRAYGRAHANYRHARIYTLRLGKPCAFARFFSRALCAALQAVVLSGTRRCRRCPWHAAVTRQVTFFTALTSFTAPRPDAQRGARGCIWS